MKKKRNTFPFKRPYFFVPMCIDYLHHGHINILIKAKKFGKVIVGLMVDKSIFSYKKKKPIIKFANRKKIIESLKIVDFVMPLRALNYPKEAAKYKFDCVEKPIASYRLHQKNESLINKTIHIKELKTWYKTMVNCPVIFNNKNFSNINNLINNLEVANLILENDLGKAWLKIKKMP